MNTNTPTRKICIVPNVNELFTPDADWNRPEWKSAPELEIREFMGPVPHFIPAVKVRLLYHPEWIYVMFRVEDHYVRAVSSAINGRVWEDSCVEFFFSPDPANPLAYFNLEVNCAGVPLFHFKDPARPDAALPSDDDIRKIVIAHSVPGLVNPEITKPLTWTIGYRIPVEMLMQYGTVARPAPGVRWGANFYKIGDKTSNPHWMTWSPIDHPVPNFHLPAQFGIIEFA